ncbi:uncharacterized protein BYT42DRAFT_586500 [Radiomyces spectabilis]|uniref:uncharacterized protein n=1 Tax=Radiomyces spectabilis TaxID=64574 RepID=UPI00221FF11C|nr:uncharacterized protein BYT42DRAFT_586500 [Radiomyces spectabilis]KAI8367500.1 hypothetical protein BYT42DRAFT_586500 [Radiomyces spectabilis]
MIRFQRLLFYLLVVVLFFLASFSLIPQLQRSSPALSDTKSDPVVTRQEEGYLSWFPHGDFAEQQEAFRNALRLAVETKRTIIAPMLRLGNPYAWLPFEDLAKRYEAQDKTVLKQLCSRNQDDWRTQMESCESLNDWTEIPWSSLFDLKVFEREFQIKIIERTSGHGWGVRESVLGGNVPINDVLVVDPMSFDTNGTEWEHVEPAMGGWQQWFTQRKPKTPVKLTEPLKKVISSSQLVHMNTRLVQFGALSSAARYQTRNTKTQVALHRALTKRLLIVPNQMTALTLQAKQITDALGGSSGYSSLHINMAKLVALDNRRNKDKTEDDNVQQQEDAAIDQQVKVESSQGEESDEQAVNGTTSMRLEDMDKNARLRMMDGVVLEIFGDIPINVAVSAGLPIQPSKLQDIVSTGELPTTPKSRRELLDACTEYRRTIELRYPIYYLVNDIAESPETRPDVFGPLLKFFPCVFSKSDFQKWGILDMSFVKRQSELFDGANHAKLLEPILDILVGGHAYSFFEIPQTPLTRFMSWQPKQ